MSDKRDETDRRLNARIVCVEVLLFLLIALLGVKAVDIQILDAGDLTQMAEREYKRTITVKGKRGEILDRNRNRLATTVDAFSVAASPADICNPAKDARALAQILGLDQTLLEKKLSRKGHFTWIKKQISPTEAEKIRQLNLKGVFFKKDVIRFYPNRNLAAQVMGIIGTGKGLEGLEYQYNNILLGKETKIRVTRDATGQCFDTEKRLEDRFSGDSLVLTIDRTIQFIAERALKEAVVGHRAMAGKALVMRPRTGEILAMAHYPEFNPNSYSSFDRKTWRNRAVTDPFEPGSVMKVFTAAAIMDQGYSTPKSIFFCENGSYKVGRNMVHDTHPHGWLTLKQIVKFSSNIGAVKLSEITGRKALFETLSSFGFGEKTNVGCPGESQGSLSNYKRWSKIDTGAISFGQGVSVTALQLISAVSVLANDGVVMKPLLVKEILNNDGTVKKSFDPVQRRRAVSAKTARDVRQMMRSVVTEEGTGTAAAIPGYSVCGKTGTAQKVVPGGKGYSKSKFTAVFVGFAPEQHPELFCLVVVDEPKGSHYGGVVAAPAFKNIMEETLHYLNIAPDMGNKQVLAVAEGA